MQSTTLISPQHVPQAPLASPMHAAPPADAAPLTPEQLQTVRDNGYIAFSNVLSPGELEECRAALRNIARSCVERPGEYNAVTGGSAPYFQHKESRLFVQMEPGHAAAEAWTADTLEAVVRKYMWFANAAPIFQQILAPEALIQCIVRSILGADPLLFQEMALVKPAFIGSEKPWHQDNAYFSVAPLDAILGVWIALDDACVENGCMHVLPGGHKAGPLKHFHSYDCEIVHDRLETSGALPVPVPAGGALFFYGLLPHETPPNRSPQRRRALQFHYRAAESTIVDEALYNTIFAERDGTPASCRAASAGK